jgi:hypothetical protein
MKNILLLIVGVGAGFVIAHEVNKSPAGKRFFEGLDHRIHEVYETVLDGYQSRRG